MHVHRRTMIIFTLFIVAAVIGSFFIFNYRQFTDELLRSYVSSLTVCGNITDEPTCVSKESCEPIYSPAGPNDPRLEFQRCQRKSLQTLVTEETQHELCRQTGGEWYENNLGQFCLCQQAGATMVFDRAQGCVVRQ